MFEKVYYQEFCDGPKTRRDEEMASVLVESATRESQTVHILSVLLVPSQAKHLSLLQIILTGVRGLFSPTESHTICIIYHVIFFSLSLPVKLLR